MASTGPKFVRLAFSGLAALVVAGIAFVYLPIAALEPKSSSPEALETFAERGEMHFAKILTGRNLDRPFPEIPMRPENPTTDARVALGHMLYFDPVLSGSNRTSCAHCHHPDLGFSDNRGRSMGQGGTGLGPSRTGGTLLRRGSPTVWNAAYNHLQFWDGRAHDLEEQAGKPIQDPAEMAQDPDELVAELRAIPEYVDLFKAAFGNGGDPLEAVSFERVTFAIAAFERTLLSQSSRYDLYARGDRQALTAAERRGLNLFRSLETRCFECHNLPTFANPDFKVIGVPETAGLDEPDLGRGEVEGGEAYARAFKVPTLRNVALTAPYMHNGSFETLSEVIDFYADGGGAGLGLELPNLDDKIRRFELSPTEKHDLIAFLHALTDTSRQPEIPASVPSGLEVVPPLANQSPELAAFVPMPEETREPVVRREGTRLIVEPGERIQDAIDAAELGDTVVVKPGTYHETLTLDLSGITLAGEVEGGQRPVLDGKNELSDGIIGTGSDLEISGFEIRDFTANGIMINLGANLVFRDLHLDNTGLYGLYPVEVVGVVIEDSSVTGARDAGFYVGQSKDIVVRRNRAFGNVTGIEIENSVNALVEDNDVTDNAGGILVFALPNVPSKVSSGCRVVGNRVIQNNHVNFADPHSIVAGVPSGTGIMILAGDDVEVTGNEIRGNNSFGVAVVGLDSQFGAGSTYDVDPNPERCWIHGNTMADNGKAPDEIVTAAGYPGADLLWDLAGTENSWDQPGASRLPYVLPGKDWAPWRRRANDRLWRLLAWITG
ncbi:MAG: parallel beta-helix domain-containing protein [Acidobacteriota bacterium]